MAFSTNLERFKSRWPAALSMSCMICPSRDTETDSVPFLCDMRHPLNFHEFYSFYGIARPPLYLFGGVAPDGFTVDRCVKMLAGNSDLSGRHGYCYIFGLNKKFYVHNSDTTICSIVCQVFSTTFRGLYRFLYLCYIEQIAKNH